MSEAVVLDRDIVRPEWHPILGVLGDDEIERLSWTEEGRAAYAEWLNIRQARIDAADEEKGDPYRSGWGQERGELPHWEWADEDLKRAGKGQYVAGGKRATKSERAAWRSVKACMELKRLKMWCLQGNERTSITEQQGLIWKYLPREIKAMNGKARHGWAKINYSTDNGFANRILVFPNRSEMHFLTYNMDAKEYQGWSIGAELSREQKEIVRRTPDLFNLGAWADEDMPMEWFRTIQMRCASRGAVWMWTYSTLEGITTTIKEIVDGAVTVKSAPAELLPQNQRHLPDCPAGHMPVVQKGKLPGISIVYFHSIWNPFPPNYQNVRELCENKPVRVIMRDAYGYSEDTRHRACPKFGPWNVIESSKLPEDGTNYMVCDPAGSRNWFTIWVRVSAGNPARFYIYREWPDEAHYGAWAVPSKNPNKFDGDAGPAQKPLGLGYGRLKALWLGLERVAKSDTADAQHRRMIEEAAALAEAGTAGPEELQEAIYARFIDPRAARDVRTAQEGGTCPIDELAKESRDLNGTLLAPPMYFLPAPGLTREAGLKALDDLLDWNQNEALSACTNEPHLYVVKECGNVIWMFNNNTATGGEDAGCKDAEDVCRYMATAGLVYVDPKMPVSRGQGAY